ncbi:MAG: hypothetical protein ACI8ZM_004366, partial [Crocinitomix sp.]
ESSDFNREEKLRGNLMHKNFSLKFLCANKSTSSFLSAFNLSVLFCH